MPQRETGRLAISDVSGGRNGVDPFTSPFFKHNQCLEAYNVEWWRTTFARKRNGTSSSSVSFSSGGPFTGKISSLLRHIPGTDETAAELWAIDDAATPVVGRKAGGTTFSAPTLKDNLTGNGWDVSAASINGKFVLAYKSAQARLHLWDGSTVRRAGLAVPGAPTVANTGSGSYAAVLRYYRVRWTEQSSGVTIRRSEAGASTSFTPSGSGTHARVTQPTVASEGETHWEVEASVDNVLFYRIATVAIGTTTYDDNAAVTSYSSNTLSATTGIYTLQKSYRFVAADQNRLLGFGSWTSTDKQNRIELSGIIGSLDVGDIERVDTTINSYVDLDENDSGEPTGLCGPMFGNFYAFKAKQMWELRPTGDVNRPYAATAISKTIGAVCHRAYCIGEDRVGNPCVYFVSHRGVYRYGVTGLEYISRGLEDQIFGPDVTINLSGTANVICHLLYHPDKRQVYFWYANGVTSKVDPSHLAVYHCETDGWVLWRNDTSDTIPQNARCAVMFSATIGATMSRNRLPYMGEATTANKIWKLDDSSVTDDGGTAFMSYIRTTTLEPWGAGFKGSTGELEVNAVGTSGSVTICARVFADANESTTGVTNGTADIQAVSPEVSGGNNQRILSRRMENSAVSDVRILAYVIGDNTLASPVSNAWTIHRIVVPYTRMEPVSA